MAALLHKRGELDRAQSLYEQGLQLFPMMPALYDGLAAVLLAQGESQRAQQALEAAVKLAPLAIRRQMQLGKLALDNEDFDSAGKAYRQAMEQGRTSKFKSPENYLGLAQAITTQAGDGVLDKRLQIEVNQALGELGKSYANDPNVQLRSRLALASSLMKSGEPKRAAQLAAEAAAELEKLPQLFAADAALNVASQLRALGQADASDALLKSCVEVYGDDPQVMQGVARQTDNVAILSGGKEATELNRQGVRCYQQKQLEAALELFRQALALQPKNISIALNTAQSLLQLGGEKITPAQLEEAQRCLEVVSQMPDSDARYARYLQLQRRVTGQ